MWKKIAIGGTVAAAIVGVGSASLAVTGDNGTTSGTPAAPSSASAPANGRHHGRGEDALARRTVHGQIVTQDPKTHEFVTHDIIRGVVTAVSSSSITVKAADNTSFTYTVNGDTTVLMRTAGQPHSGKKGAIGDVKNGDKVLVTGTGTASPYTAKHIVDGIA
jgi:hypothetical protein